MDIVTSSVAEAFTVAANPAFSGDISTFALSDMTVVYDELQVSPEFMSALRNKVSMQPFTIGIQDRTWLGICDGRNPTRVNIGVGLSSMKALVGINVYGNSTTRDLKYSAPNGLKRWSLFINGQQINSMNLDSDVQNYIEFTRAIQSMYDLKRVSCAYPVTNDAASTTRSTIQTYQFAFGLSTAVYSDVNFALSGIPVDQLSVEFDRQANPDPVKWGGATTNLDGFLTHMWALHDSVMTILPDGTVSIRK